MMVNKADSYSCSGAYILMEKQILNNQIYK